MVTDSPCSPPPGGQAGGGTSQLTEATTGTEIKVTSADEGVEKQARALLVGMYHGAATLGGSLAFS